MWYDILASFFFFARTCLILVGERDTLRGNTMENRGCLFVYIFGRTYVILYFDPLIFLC